MKLKKLLSGLYLTLCLLALFAEPSRVESLRVFLLFYTVVLANLALAARLVNQSLKKK
jgi:hypothetical protein